MKFSFFLVILYFFLFKSIVSAEVIEYLSYTPNNFEEIYQDNFKHDPVRLTGELILPEGLGKFPVVVLQHGTGDNKKKWYKNLANELKKNNIGTFINDSYTNRELSGADLTLAPRVIDGLFLLNALSNHPKIDKNRIGIQGYSYGGMVAFFTAYEGLINKVGVQYAAHMPVYPGCDVVIKDMVTTSAPILMIIAENDDYAPAADCIDYGPNIGKIKIYKDAYHGFISTKKKKEFLKNTGHFNDCERGYIQDDGKWFYNGKTRNGTESEIFSEIWKECGNQGVHIGGTSKIRELLIEDTIEFFSKHLLEN